MNNVVVEQCAEPGCGEPLNGEMPLRDVLYAQLVEDRDRIAVNEDALGSAPPRESAPSAARIRMRALSSFWVSSIERASKCRCAGGSRTVLAPPSE